MQDSDDVVWCGLCEFWHHIKCDGASKEVFKFSGRGDASKLHSYCNKCDVVAGKVLKYIAKLEKRKDVMETRMKNPGKETNTKLDAFEN